MQEGTHKLADSGFGVRTELSGEEGILESESGSWLVPEALVILSA